MVQKKSLKDWALDYASKGWAVFPLVPKGKIPLASEDKTKRSGFYEATTNAETIKKWWDKNPNYNIGIATGQMSNGIVVIDLDNDPDKGKEGEKLFKQWCSDNKITPPNSLKVRSGKGGYHLYFHSGKTLQCKENVNRLMGIDIRADGGYIVAPPSIHPNGKPYTWCDVTIPSPKSLAELTPELEKFVKGSSWNPAKENTHRQQTVNTPQAAGQKVMEGSRTSYLVSQIGILCNTGLDDEMIRQAITSLNNNMCNPPLSDSELEREVFKALNRGWQENTPPAAEILPSLITADLSDIIEEDIPELKFFVSGLLPEGFGFLAAPPKSYKSFLCLQFCAAVAKGQQVLGRNTIKSKCLYFDLESEHRRPKDRSIKMGIAQELGNEKGLIKLVTKKEIKEFQRLRGQRGRLTLANGFAEVLENYLNECPDIGLVIIDVWGKIRTEQKRTQQLYEHDYEDIEKLQDIAQRKRVCILAVHHTTKSRDENNPFNNMGGSIGTLGAADFALLIDKQKYNDKEAILRTNGRDDEALELSIRFETSKLKWEYLGTAEEVQIQKDYEDYQNSNITKTIKTLVSNNGGTYEGTSSDILKGSKYSGTPIYENTTHIGRFIQSNYDFFIQEGYEIDHGKGRTYIFKNENVKKIII